MKEDIIKELLMGHISKDFNVIKGAESLHFSGKKIRPDILLNLKNSDILIVIELKDDTSKNYNSNELLRQAIDYKHSKYDGKIPDFVFVTTTKLMDGNGAFSVAEGRAFGLAAKLGVGHIYISNSKQLRFKVGSRKPYTLDIPTGDVVIDFTRLKLIVGTKAKSNKVRIV